MPFDVAALPRGLIDLLNLRTSGESPRLLNDQVSLNVDGTEMYLSPFLVAVPGNTAAGTPPALGYNNCLTVPPNEFWILMQANLSVTAEAGVTFQAFPAMVAGSTVILGPSIAVPAASTRYGATNPLRVALPAGVRMGVFIEQLTGVPTVASSAGFTALVYRLRAGG